MIDVAMLAPQAFVRRQGQSLPIRLDHVGVFVLGCALALLENALRKEQDLPIVELFLALWGVAEFLAGRVHLEAGRKISLYVLGGCCTLFGAWIILADLFNAQSWGTTLRNLLKYEISFLMFAWLAHSPSQGRIASFLVGSMVGISIYGTFVLMANPDAPHLAKYHTPYWGVILLAIWAGGRPFNGGWRWILPPIAVFIGLLASEASARWSMLSGLLVLAAMLLPRLSATSFRVLLALAALAPVVPLLLLDTPTALRLIAELDLQSASDVERLVLYAFAHDTLLRNPFTGIGFENFLTSFEREFGHILRMESAVQGPHNQYAAVGSMFGVPGMLLYAAAVCASMNLLHEPERAPTRVAQAAVMMFGFAFLANEVADDQRLAVYLVAVLLCCGAPARSSLAAALLPGRAASRPLVPIGLVVELPSATRQRG